MGLLCELQSFTPLPPPLPPCPPKQNIVILQLCRGKKKGGRQGKQQGLKGDLSKPVGFVGGSGSNKNSSNSSNKSSGQRRGGQKGVGGGGGSEGSGGTKKKEVRTGADDETDVSEDDGMSDVFGCCRTVL